MHITDDRKRVLSFPVAPRRVVSLVPSDTLTLAELGCGNALVGRTDYCELPVDLVSKIPSVGGTKNPRLDDIRALAPDLVIANQEENQKSDLEELAQSGIRVYVGFPKRVADGISHVAKLARIFRVEREASVRALIQTAYGEMRARETWRASPGFQSRSVFCPIWMDPLMTINEDTFISDALREIGLHNVFGKRVRKYPLAADLGKKTALSADEVGDRDTRYPRVSIEELVSAQPDLVLLPSEPHAFSEADAEVFRALPIPAAKSGQVRFVDGKDLCWYGVRSIGGIARLAAATRP